MHRINKGDLDAIEGVWRKAPTPEKHVVLMSCPDCGRVISLLNYEILLDGRLLPSVVCPYTDCFFHKYCQLMDWSLESDENET